ncbi:MAG TPA: tail fiber domain-containing protein [Bryobacteraceae bacterium]|nr:tail fiber domain-containing protein [Bryobacteraceae bacterium]
MTHIRSALAVCLGVSCVAAGYAQQGPVPRLVNYSGVLRDGAGKPVSGSEAVTFSIYADADSRTPLWQETQNITADEQGRYTVHLGAATADGLPLDLFASGGSLWLGALAQSRGAVEQARVLLVSVPYALKAADADTLGGKPASAFVTREAASATAGESVAAVSGTHSRETIGATAAIGGAGAAGYIPVWTDSADIGNSVLFQSGTRIGLGTTVPSYDFDLYKSQNQDTVFEVRNPNTGSTARANLRLLSDQAVFSMIAGSAANGGGLYFQGQGDTMMAFQQIANAPMSFLTNGVERMRLLANGNVGIGTAAPAAKLEVNGTAKFDGLITFAAGQTFPGGGGGTITAVNPGAGMTGGGTSGSVTLGLQSCSAGQELESSGSGWQCVVPLSSVKAGTDLTVGSGGPGSVVVNVDTTKVPELASANVFTVQQTFQPVQDVPGILAYGGAPSGAGNGPAAIQALGSNGSNGGQGGAGITATGGNSDTGSGGDGIDAVGGTGGVGGSGIYAVAGKDNSGNPAPAGWFSGQVYVISSGGFSNPQAELVQQAWGDYSRLRMFVQGGAAQAWDIAAGGGAQPAMNFYRHDVGNVMSLTPGGSNLMSMSNGAYLTSGGAWTNSSDRNLKSGLRQVSGADVLKRLSAVPITTWSYKAEGEEVRHMGPMAQDFAAAFRLGSDDKHITTIDESGVALAAIQQLYRDDQKLRREEQDLRRENQQLKSALAELEARVAALASAQATAAQEGRAGESRAQQVRF